MGEKLIARGKKSESQLLNQNIYNLVQKKKEKSDGHLIRSIVDNDK